MDTMRNITIALLIAVATLAGCAEDDDPIAPSSEPTRSSPASPGTETPTPETSPAREIALDVWLTAGESLRPVRRNVQGTSAVARAAVEMLLGGPTSREDGLKIASEVPAGVDLLDISISDGVATVDLSGSFDDGGGSATMRMRLAQLIYTVTQFDTVSGMLLRLDGEPVDTFSSEGIVISEPQRRKGFRDLLPPIVVTDPGIDGEESAPLEISGTANVFEATVSFRLVVDGAEIATGFATATCGTGCRGKYQGTLDFEVDEPTEAVLEVFESSAEDGSPLHLVSIPIRLLP